MRPGEVGNASVAACQVRQNLPARGIGQRGKSPVQRSRRIFNHLVNYLAESLRRANIFYKFGEASSRHVFRRFTDPQETRRGERRYNNVYESDCVNASLFTTYGIFVGSPL